VGLAGMLHGSVPMAPVHDQFPRDYMQICEFEIPLLPESARFRYVSHLNLGTQGGVWSWGVR